MLLTWLTNDITYDRNVLIATSEQIGKLPTPSPNQRVSWEIQRYFV